MRAALLAAVLVPGQLPPGQLPPGQLLPGQVLAGQVLAGQVLAGQVLAGLGAQDRRGAIDAARLPWSAVMRVQIAGVSRCTGFAVGARLVVTAAHCLYGRRLGRMMPAGSVHVLSGYVRGGFARHSVAVSYRLGAGFAPGSLHPLQGGDVALLTLADRIADAALVPVAAMPGQAAMLGGYSQDRAELLIADAGCRVLGMLDDPGGRPLVLHSCQGTLGTSGAPLLVRLANGAWEAAGVQAAVIQGRPGGVAVAAAAVQDLLRTH